MKFENSSRLFADCVASIDARRLYGLGLFQRSPNRLVFECQVLSAEAPELEVELRWDGAAGLLQIRAPARSDAPAQSVRVARRARPRGGGYYFVCPEAGDACEKLYYVDGSWAGRKAKRLGYSSQSGSLRDRYSYSLRRLTAQLEGAHGRPLPCPDRRARIEARIAQIERTLAALPVRRAARFHPDAEHYPDLLPLAAPAEQPAAPPVTGRALAADRAIERAEALPDDGGEAIAWLYRRGETLRAAVGAAPDGLGARVSGLPPDYLENHPRIGLRTLASLGLLRPGWRRGVRLDWSGLGCGLDACNLLLDLREPGLWFAGLELVGGGQMMDQALRIVAAPEGGARFVCPLSGAEVDTIAYRAGAFASPRALRLTRRTGRA